MRNISIKAAAAAVGAVALLAMITPVAARSQPCPRGYRAVQAHGVVARDARGVLCVAARHPEAFRELALRDRQTEAAALAPMSAADAEGFYRASLDERAALIAAGPTVTGTGGSWTPYGKGPLYANDERYEISGEGLAELGGRIDSLDYDPAHKRLFAAVGTGGVWMSENLGGKWVSIGDRLPTQVNGALAWSPAKGGTLVVASGEALVAGLTRTGMGAYFTRDLGKTWRHSKGVPDGALGFQVAVDPAQPAVVYVATSKGLFRSADAGETFANVKLPTGECAGKTDNGRCLLANQVTDVVVQAPDAFGHKGGRVLAAVGYRAGKRPFPQQPDVIESPANGLYRSDTGLPGTFEPLPLTGFASHERVGRTELGVASGPDQNHDYVYAIVQDAILFQGGLPTIDAPEDAWPGVWNTVLNGVYVSSDFGSTWTLMADSNQISQNPASGSALAGVGQATLYAPGVQSWYNEWIKPDPTRQDSNGVPTRLTFGLEEVWQNELTTQPQNGRSAFKVIGRYFAGESCMLLNTGLPACPTNRPVTPSTTTHPDQHDAVYVPDGSGGVTLVVGNDGGAFVQHAQGGEEFDNTKWGDGANRGFNTLLPYQAVAAKDGTVWFGLQDNGSGKIEPGSRKYLMTFGGDGFYAAVDPDNSNYAWTETTFADMRVTTDGGVNWKSVSPPITDSQFATPFVMDPLDSNHLITAGRQVVETLAGANSTCGSASCSWKEVFNLGTHAHPGDAAAESSGDDPANSMSAVALRGAAAYAGFCGPCDIISTDVTYKNGLATNVGGTAPPAKGAPDGWHIAAAKGLPNRTITGIEIDPKDPKTVYVTVGGYARRAWRDPGTFGDKNKTIGQGHVFVSHDAGATFTDISRGLPNAPANAIVRRGTQLIVGTDVGVFLSGDLKGSQWAALNRGLPVVPVVSVQVMPGNANSILIATFGRGIYSYTFPIVERPPAPPKPAKVQGVKKALAATGIGDPTTGVIFVAMAAALALRLTKRDGARGASR